MKPADRHCSASIVNDGRARALAGAAQTLAEWRARVTAETEEKYASRLERAGIIRRCWLRLRMNREIQRQMRREEEKIAPRNAMYGTASHR